MRCFLKPRARTTKFGWFKLKRTSKRPIRASNTAVMRAHALDAAAHGLPFNPYLFRPLWLLK